MASPIFEQYRAAIERQPLPGLDAIVSAAARDFGAGGLTWDELAEVNDLVQARRDRAKAAPEPKPPRVHRGATPRTPESIERRREWAEGNQLPGSFRGKFPTAQLGVVKFLLKWCFEQGACRLPIEAIAAKVGTCKTVVREAVRKAVGYGLIESKEHRRSHWRNDPNTIRIVSQEVKDWLRIGAEMAKRAAGVAVRIKAQAGKVWHQRKADDRRAAQTVRREAACPLPGGGGSRFAEATQEPSLREESSAASRRSEVENGPIGSSTSGAWRSAPRTSPG